MAIYNAYGQEIPDQTKMELPIGYHHPEPLSSMIQRLINVESQKASREGNETFEEADDFNLDEEEEQFTSQYTMQEMEEETLREKVPSDAPTPTETPVETVPTEEAPAATT